MRLLFSIDKQDYADCTYTFVRNSARSIILRDGKVAMIHSLRKVNKKVCCIRSRPF